MAWREQRLQRAHCTWITGSATIGMSGSLTALSAPGVGPWPWLSWVAFAPWLASVPQLPPRWAALSGLTMGLAYIIPGHWNTFATAIEGAGYRGLWRELGTLLFFSCYALPFAAYGWLDHRLRRWAGHTAVQALALLRASVLASLICGVWSPFPYTPVTAVVDTLGFVQWASVGGEPLLLTLLLWPGALLATLGHTRPTLTRSLPALLWMVLTLATLDWAGHARMARMDDTEASGGGQRLSALSLQLDLPAGAAPALLTRDRPDADRSAVELTRAGLRQHPYCELVIWPETPVPARYGTRSCAAGQALADDLGKPVLMQCHRAPSGQQQLTAEWLQPHQPAAFHAKSSLVPGYEQPLWGSGPLRAGTAGRTFDLDAQRKVVPALCYELHAGPHLRRSVLAGGQFVAHMASFTAFDRHPIDLWDQPMAQLRAVAYGVPIVRASNRAPIGWIDANGRIRQQSERFGHQAQCLHLWSPASTPTVYAHLGWTAAWLPAVVLLGLTRLLSRSTRWRTPAPAISRP